MLMRKGDTSIMDDDAAALDLMGETYTTPISEIEDYMDESKFDKMRKPLKVCILGVDGLEHEALNRNSRLTCRLHLMDEFGKPALQKNPFPLDRHKHPYCAQLPRVGVKRDPHGSGDGFRARYDDNEKTLKKLELDVFQTFAYPRWKGRLLVEFSIPNPKFKEKKEWEGEEEEEEAKVDENAKKKEEERDIVVARFDIPYTSFADGKTVRFCVPKKLPEDDDASWDEPTGLMSQDNEAKLYLKLWNEFEEKSDADINYNLMLFFDANVAYLNEPRDLCVGMCKPCDEFKRLEFRETVPQVTRKIVHQRTIHGIRHGLHITEKLNQLIRMSSEYLEKGLKHLDNLILRRFEVASIVLKVRHMRFWAEHAPEKFFCPDDSDEPSKDNGWQSFTDEVRAAFMTEAYESYCNTRLRRDLVAMYVVIPSSFFSTHTHTHTHIRRLTLDKSIPRYEKAPADIGTDEQKNHHLTTWICNANCFASLSLAELMIQENSQITENKDENTRAQFWTTMKNHLAETRRLMNDVKTKCDEIKMTSLSNAIEKSLTKASKMFKKSIFADIEDILDKKISKNSATDSTLTKKLVDLKERILKLPSAESNNKDFHSLVLEIDTGRHVEDDLVKQSGFRFFAKDDNTHIDDGSMVYLQRREHYEETERDQKEHRDTKYLLGGSMLKLFDGPRQMDLVEEDMDTKETYETDNGKTLYDDLKSLKAKRSGDVSVTVSPGPPPQDSAPHAPKTPGRTSIDVAEI